jgi:class 3 adenylate cyclase
MAIDLKDFSKLAPSVQLRVVERLYPKLAELVGVSNGKALLDKKTIGDGFMFYFGTALDALESALNIRALFLDTLFWREKEFNPRLQCRIGLHFGQFFRETDAIEQRLALFGHNVTTVARLEPIVGINEIWCTQSFSLEAQRHRADFASDIVFQDLGIRQLAKGWGPENVYGIRFKKDKAIVPISNAPRIIRHNNKHNKLKHTYFALVRMRDRTRGVKALKSHLTDKLGCRIEAVYYIFGVFDIIVRFKRGKRLDEEVFACSLEEEGITEKEEHCSLTEVHFEGKSLVESIVKLPKSRKYIKAFAWIKSTNILKRPHRVRKVVELARRACGKELGVVTYYTNSDVLILPIVIPVENYYALADAIEHIERWVDNQGLKYESIITYPVHGFDMEFKDQETQ